MIDVTELFVCHDLNHIYIFFFNTSSIALPSVFLCSMLPFVQRFYSNVSMSQHLRVQTDELSSYLQLGDFGQPQFLNRLHCIH